MKKRIGTGGADAADMLGETSTIASVLGYGRDTDGVAQAFSCLPLAFAEIVLGFVRKGGIGQNRWEEKDRMNGAHTQR